MECTKIVERSWEELRGVVDEVDGGCEWWTGEGEERESDVRGRREQRTKG